MAGHKWDAQSDADLLLALLEVSTVPPGGLARAHELVLTRGYSYTLKAAQHRMYFDLIASHPSPHFDFTLHTSCFFDFSRTKTYRIMLIMYLQAAPAEDSPQGGKGRR